MLIKNIAIGSDIEDISRFKHKTIDTHEKFLKLIYSDQELDYCFSKNNPAQHLAVRYCGKEAAIKAMYDLGIEDLQYKDIEIINDPNGAPRIYISKYQNFNLRISLSHSRKYAIANVLILEI